MSYAGEENVYNIYIMYMFQFTYFPAKTQVY